MTLLFIPTISDILHLIFKYIAYPSPIFTYMLNIQNGKVKKKTEKKTVFNYNNTNGLLSPSKVIEANSIIHLKSYAGMDVLSVFQSNTLCVMTWTSICNF